MHAKKFLKVGLKSWDWGIFGTTTSFYEMHTAHPLLDQMSVTFKNEFSLFVQILYNFSFDLLGMTDCLIMTTFCLIFAVPLQVDTHLKIIGNCFKINFSDVQQKIEKLQQNQIIYWNKKNLFLKLTVTDIWSNRGRAVCIS